MSYELNGLSELQRQLEKQLGISGMKPVIERALTKGAEQFDEVLIPELEKFKDTGATIDDTTYSKVEMVDGEPKIRIHWNGPSERYRLVHLNEHGYSRNGRKVKPRGYGAIARAMAKGRPVFYAAVKKELERGV